MVNGMKKVFLKKVLYKIEDNLSIYEETKLQSILQKYLKFWKDATWVFNIGLFLKDLFNQVLKQILKNKCLVFRKKKLYNILTNCLDF